MNQQQISINDPLLPIAIKDTVIKQWREGDLLFQVETAEGIEWWQISSNGELIDVLWLSDK